MQLNRNGLCLRCRAAIVGAGEWCSLREVALNLVQTADCSRTAWEKRAAVRTRGEDE